MAKKENINEIKAGSLKGKFKNKINSVEETEQPVIKPEGSQNGLSANNSKMKPIKDKNIDEDKKYIVIGGKKYQVIENFYASKREVKYPPNPQFFKLLKQGKTKNGKGWFVCEYKGRKFLIEEPALSWLNAKEVENGLEIDISKSIVVRTNEKGGLKLVPKVPPRLWFGLETLKEQLSEGVNSETINNIVKESNLNLEMVEKSRYGKFIAIQPDSIFHFDERHKIHIYPGKSVKEHGFENLSLIDFINKYDERLNFKSFEFDGKTLYRFYLKKIKNSFTAKQEQPKKEEESEMEMLLNALNNEPKVDSDLVTAQEFMNALKNIEKTKEDDIDLSDGEVLFSIFSE